MATNNGVTEGVTLPTGHTYRDYGWYMSAVKHGSPQKKEVIVDVPYTDGVLDFSDLDGRFHWGSREVAYTFVQKFNDIDEMVIQTNRFESDLRDVRSDITDDLLWGGAAWHNARCISVEHTYHPKGCVAVVDVRFRCDPWPNQPGAMGVVIDYNPNL